MKPTCCLVWLLQGLQAEQCPGADQDVGVGAGDLQTGAGDLQQVPQVDGGDLQSRPPPPGLYSLLHFRSLAVAAPADDSAAVSSPESQVIRETGQNSCQGTCSASIRAWASS